MTFEDIKNSFDHEFSSMFENVKEIQGYEKEIKDLLNQAYIAGLDAAKGAVPEMKEAGQYDFEAVQQQVIGYNSCRQQTLDAIELEKGKVHGK